MKNILNAIKNNPNKFREKLMFVATAVAASVLAGAIFSKMEDERVDVILVKENPPVDETPSE